MCMEMWTIEIPAWLEFTNITIVHDFLLRLYLVIHEYQKTYKWRLNIFSGCLNFLHFFICVTVSSFYCDKIADDIDIHGLVIKVTGIT